MELSAEFKSFTYAGLSGKLVITLISDNVISCNITYDNNSSYSPGAKKTISVNIARNISQRISGQSDLNNIKDLKDQHFAITLAFDKPILTGYYASMCPIDCGIIKPNESKRRWEDVLKVKN